MSGPGLVYWAWSVDIKKKNLSRGGTLDTPRLHLFVFTLCSLHRYRFFDPHLYNQYPTTSPSINLSFMSSFRLAFSLLLYILFISFEWKPKLELLSLIYGDQTEWKIPCYLRSRWQNHAFPRCHTGSPRNPAAFPLDSFLGGLEPYKEDAYWDWDAVNWRAGICFHAI